MRRKNVEQCKCKWKLTMQSIDASLFFMQRLSLSLSHSHGGVAFHSVEFHRLMREEKSHRTRSLVNWCLFILQVEKETPCAYISLLHLFSISPFLVYFFSSSHNESLECEWWKLLQHKIEVCWHSNVSFLDEKDARMKRKGVEEEDEEEGRERERQQWKSSQMSRCCCLSRERERERGAQGIKYMREGGKK